MLIFEVLILDLEGGIHVLAKTQFTLLAMSLQAKPK